MVGRLFDEENKFCRAVLSAKANIVPGVPPAYLFDLDSDSGFAWAGVSETVTARDLIREQHSRQGRPSEQTERAAEIILGTLNANGGEMLSADLLTAVTTEGISVRTYKRAKSALGIVSFKRGDSWFSRVPKIESAENADNFGTDDSPDVDNEQLRLTDQLGRSRIGD